MINEKIFRVVVTMKTAALLDSLKDDFNTGTYTSTIIALCETYKAQKKLVDKLSTENDKFEELKKHISKIAKLIK